MILKNLLLLQEIFTLNCWRYWIFFCFYQKNILIGFNICLNIILLVMLIWIGRWSLFIFIFFVDEKSEQLLLREASSNSYFCTLIIVLGKKDSHIKVFFINISHLGKFVLLLFKTLLFFMKCLSFNFKIAMYLSCYNNKKRSLEKVFQI